MDSQTSGQPLDDDLEPTEPTDAVDDAEDLEDEQDLSQTDDSSDDAGLDPNDARDFDAFLDDIEELRDFRERAERTLGHVSANQRAIAKLEAQLGNNAEIQALRAQNDAMMAILEELAPDAEGLNALRQARADAELDRRVAEKVRAAQPAPQQDSVPPEWQAATANVYAYARGKGIDGNSIPQEVWDEAQASGDPETAQRLVERAVDRLADSDNQNQRRRTRKRAGETQKAAGRTGASGSGLTMEKLAQMTAEEILKLPREEVDRVLEGR